MFEFGILKTKMGLVCDVMGTECLNLNFAHQIINRSYKAHVNKAGWAHSLVDSCLYPNESTEKTAETLHVSAHQLLLLHVCLPPYRVSYSSLCFSRQTCQQYILTCHDRVG